MTKNFRSEPPTLEEVIAYAEEIGSPTDPVKFFRLYSPHWELHGDPIRDWKALFRYWTSKDREKPRQTVSAVEYRARKNPIDKEKLKAVLRAFPEAAEGVDLPSTFWE